MTAPFAMHIMETVAGRHVGYRRGGEGPPVVLLHESPRSSIALMALAERLGPRFTVFALDTPGFGLSDALPLARPTSADFADALAQTLDLLGLGRVPVYGTHTGAVIAAAFGERHPDRTACLVLDGYPVFAPTEQAEYLTSYLAPLAPDWTGTHLAWLWSRVKDQFSFFPWYARGDGARLPRPLAPLDLMQTVVCDFLAAGDSYRPAYASAFRFMPVDPVGRISAPTVYTCRSDDLLFAHLDRLPPLPSMASIMRLGPDRDIWGTAIGDVFARFAEGTSPAIIAQPPRGDRTRPSRRIIHTSCGTIGFEHHAGPPRTRPLVLLHELPGAARAMADVAREAGCARDVYALEVPGFGFSRSNDPTAAGIAAAIVAGIDAIGIAAFDLAGYRESNAIAALVAKAAGPRLGTLHLIDPVPDPLDVRGTLAAAVADVTPRHDGTHLLAAWHQLRDTALWKPWTSRTPSASRPFGPDPDVVRLDAIFTAWMRGGEAARATVSAALHEPLQPLLPGISARIEIVAHPGHAWHVAATDIATAAKASLTSCADDATAIGHVLCRLTGGAS